MEALLRSGAVRQNVPMSADSSWHTGSNGNGGRVDAVRNALARRPAGRDDPTGSIAEMGALNASQAVGGSEESDAASRRKRRRWSGPGRRCAAGGVRGARGARTDAGL